MQFLVWIQLVFQRIQAGPSQVHMLVVSLPLDRSVYQVFINTDAPCEFCYRGRVDRLQKQFVFLLTGI
jgi:hypothetical protein